MSRTPLLCSACEPGRHPPRPSSGFSRQAPGRGWGPRLGACRQRGRLSGHVGAGSAGSYLLLGFAAGLVDRVLVLFGGLARVLLLLVVFGRLRVGKDGTVSAAAGSREGSPPPQALRRVLPPSGSRSRHPAGPPAPPSPAVQPGWRCPAHHAAAAPPRCRPRKEAAGARRGEAPCSRAASGARRDATSGSGRPAPWRSSAFTW